VWAPPINVSARNISARNALQVFVVVNGKTVPGKAARVVSIAPKTTGTVAGLSWTRGRTVVVWNQNVLNGRNVGATVQVTSITVG
jgi:hypothetical protein